MKLMCFFVPLCVLGAVGTAFLIRRIMLGMDKRMKEFTESSFTPDFSDRLVPTLEQKNAMDFVVEPVSKEQFATREEISDLWILVPGFWISVASFCFGLLGALISSVLKIIEVIK